MPPFPGNETERASSLAPSLSVQRSSVDVYEVRCVWSGLWDVGATGVSGPIQASVTDTDYTQMVKMPRASYVSNMNGHQRVQYQLSTSTESKK